jgi:hypothetical protein
MCMNECYRRNGIPERQGLEQSNGNTYHRRYTWTICMEMVVHDV